MRVLHVINSLQIGGAEALLVELASRFRKRGIEVDLYALTVTGSFLEKRAEQLGLPTYFSPVSSVYSPQQVVALAKHLQFQKYDLVHAHLFPAQLWVSVLWKWMANAPLITTEHSTYNRRRKYGFFRLMDRWMYQPYRAIVAVSQATANNLSKWVPEIAHKIRVIYNGIDTSHFLATEPADLQALGVKRPVIICVGRLERQKDQATLLKALTRMDKVHLLLVGDGYMKDELQALTRRLGINHRVHIVGRRGDVAALLRSSDVYVQPSQWEGFGLATIEAMAAGTPVIVSNVEGLREVVGNAGLYFEPGDVQGLAERIALVLNDPAFRRELSTRGRERAKLFDIDSTAEQYSKLYHDLVESYL
ncbi:glycosyltransferase [Thermus caldilimi]|uniref:glycosyltransferase n=1 Tax=Thermus caldilimi TaxID=2483360 RepID=UPI00107692B2|nr:glycosyltransferase [Thermus caldilimi]